MSHLQSGEAKDAVVKAHKSVESVMKTVLETSDHLTFGRLLANLIKSGLLPSYYEGFMSHFEQLALAVVKPRNRPGTGHGQGRDAIEVPINLAELALNLAGSINVFLMQEWLERREPPAQHDGFDNDVPF